MEIHGGRSVEALARAEVFSQEVSVKWCGWVRFQSPLDWRSMEGVRRKQTSRECAEKFGCYSRLLRRTWLHVFDNRFDLKWNIPMFLTLSSPSQSVPEQEGDMPFVAYSMNYK